MVKEASDIFWEAARCYFRQTLLSFIRQKLARYADGVPTKHKTVEQRVQVAKARAFS